MQRKVYFSDREQTASAFIGFDCDESVFADLQRFIDEAPELKIGETFFFGHWLLKLVNCDGSIELHELDFMANKYVPGVSRAARLWCEQKSVCVSQKVLWHSLDLNQKIYLTPKTLAKPRTCYVEGVHFPPSSDAVKASWYIYTREERETETAFICKPYGSLVTAYDLSILRFMALPENWWFAVRTDGSSNTWFELPK